MIFYYNTNKAKMPTSYNHIINYKLDKILKKRNTTFFNKLKDYLNNKIPASFIANITQKLNTLLVILVLFNIKHFIITIYNYFRICILNICDQNHILQILPKNYYSGYTLLKQDIVVLF
jgi:hypothetical protein